MELFLLFNYHYDDLDLRFDVEIEFRLGLNLPTPKSTHWKVDLPEKKLNKNSYSLPK